MDRGEFILGLLAKAPKLSNVIVCGVRVAFSCAILNNIHDVINKTDKCDLIVTYKAIFNIAYNLVIIYRNVRR